MKLSMAVTPGNLFGLVEIIKRERRAPGGSVVIVSYISFLKKIYKSFKCCIAICILIFEVIIAIFLPNFKFHWVMNYSPIDRISRQRFILLHLFYTPNTQLHTHAHTYKFLGRAFEDLVDFLRVLL